MSDKNKWEELRAQEMKLADQLEETERKRYKIQQLVEDWQDYVYHTQNANQELGVVFQGSDQAYNMELSTREIESYSFKIEENYDSMIQDYRKQENKLMDKLDVIAQQKRILCEEEKK